MGKKADLIPAHDEVDEVPALLGPVQKDPGKGRASFEAELTLDHRISQRKFPHFHGPVPPLARFKATQNAGLCRPRAELPEPLSGKFARERFVEDPFPLIRRDGMRNKQEKAGKPVAGEIHGASWFRTDAAQGAVWGAVGQRFLSRLGPWQAFSLLGTALANYASTCLLFALSEANL
jgi:hypothetical protein